MEKRFKNKKCLVTGGAGFIGSHLTDKLIEEGAEVIVIDNLYMGDIKNVNPKAKFIKADFYKDDIDKYFDGIDYVFHVGAWGRMPMCLEDPIGAYENNVLGSVKVLEASKKAGVKKVVLSSSCIVYCEDTPYKTTKVAMEDIARVYRKIYGLPTICLRYSNVYGTRQNTDKDSAMFAMFRKAYKENGHINIFGDGEQTRDWTHVYDVCEANMLSALSDYEGELDICTGRSVSVNYIVNDLLKAKAVYLPERKGDAKHIVMNPKPAEEAIGFRAKIKLEDGIKDVWPWL